MVQIWAPHVIDNINDSELELYLQFSGTACIPGGGCNVEEALRVLYQSKGDLKLAMQQLLAYDKTCQPVWTLDEVRMFERLVSLHGKNFHLISQDLSTKSVKECVLFYYLWKKSPLRRNISPKQQYIRQHISSNSVAPSATNGSSATTNALPSAGQPLSALTSSSSSSLYETPQSVITISLFPSSSITTSTSDDSGRESSSTSMTSFSSISTTNNNNSTSATPTTPAILSAEEFPCRVCGRVFAKIKSRSAHMKRHKNER